MTDIQTHNTNRASIALARALAFFCPSLLYWNSASLFLILHISQVLIIAIAFNDIELSLMAYAVFIIVINSLYSVIRRCR